MTESLRQRPGDQPLPTEGKLNVQDALIRHIEQRRKLGIERYGRPLQTFNGRNAVLDLVEELLDGATYAMQVEMENKAVQARIHEALHLHRADDLGLCASCKVLAPCATRRIFLSIQLPPVTITRVDPVEEVACSPDAIVYVREHFQITPVQDERCIPPAPLGEYMGLPVYVDDELPPRTVRLRPSTSKQ